jgi:hypothetical protein
MTPLTAGRWGPRKAGVAVPRDRKLKRAVRSEMRRSGLRYTEALVRVRAGLAPALDAWSAPAALGAPSRDVEACIVELMPSAAQAYDQ